MTDLGIIIPYLQLTYPTMEQIFGAVDFSFKYILLGFNFLTLIAVYIHKRTKKTKREHHVLFVTAHPDDEVMFFGPTTNDIAADYFVHLLCLSGGGSAREQELRLSAQNLALYRFQCLNNERLQDGMKEKWCEQTIRQEVRRYVREQNIRAIFTFDAYGVSGHINHQAIHRALKQCETLEEIKPVQQTKQTQTLKQEQNEGQAQNAQKQKVEESKVLKIYYLQSTNIIRKYSGCLQILIALLKDFSWVRINYISAWQAMKFHKSQFTWFRKLWVLFSRYTYANTYQLRRVRL